MEITYTKKYRDLWYFHFTESLRSMPSKITWLIAIGVVIYVHLTSPSTDYSTFESVLASITIFFLLILVLIIYLALFTLITSFSKKNKIFVTEHKLILTDNAIYGETEFSKSEISWNSIIRVKNVRRYILIYIAKHTAIVIPKRYFRSEEEQKALIEYVRKQWDKSKVA
jgi:hypothetical protein